MVSRLIADAKSGYTYDNYLSWNEDEIGRCELIYGDVYMMASPGRTHFFLLDTLLHQFKMYLLDKPCKVFFAPYDVRLFPQEDDSDTTVVQPDMFVVCDEQKYSDERAIKGVPDLVAEVVSPGSKAMDLHIKKDLYLKAGVKEYWVVVSPYKIIVHLLSGGAYQELVYQSFNSILEVPVGVFNNQLKIIIKEQDIFPQKD